MEPINQECLSLLVLSLDLVHCFHGYQILAGRPHVLQHGPKHLQRFIRLQSCLADTVLSLRGRAGKAALPSFFAVPGTR